MSALEIVSVVGFVVGCVLVAVLVVCAVAYQPTRWRDR